MASRWLAVAAAVAVAASTPSMVASPASTLLPPGTTSLQLQLTTTDAASCRWDFANVPYASMANSFSGDGTLAHDALVSGLSGTLNLTVVYVQCDVYASSQPPLVLSYRCLPDSGNAPFPRLGNLWGSGNFAGHPSGLAYAASRSSLWLGSSWTVPEIAQLRGFNPFTVALTSINACETNEQDLPDSFYLLNITQPSSTKGRLQSWPGAWRLDLTNPAVQAYQAGLMYCLVVYGGSGYGTAGCSNATVPPMIYDGLFVDNVFLDDGAEVNSQDIFHNPFIPLDQTTGKPFVDFNTRWHDGMVAMLQQFRSMMPHAILSGHAMDVTDPNVTALFNAISIGFTTPQIIEGYTPFSTGLQQYNDWMTLPQHDPKVTMVESAVRFQYGYGYGFNTDLSTLMTYDCQNSHSDPSAPMPGIGNACDPTAPQKPGYMLPQTWLTARSEYQYMRFGLGFTLMNDGFYTHELGDSWHGMDWDYDELHFNLGLALGNATFANVSDPNPPPVPPPIPLPPTTGWTLWVRYPNSSNASWAVDSNTVPYAGAPASLRVDVSNTAPSVDSIDLYQDVPSFQVGGYQLSFWARSSVAGTPLYLDTRKSGGDWHNFGLNSEVTVGTTWQQFNVTFTSVADGSDGRLSFWYGSAAANASVWINAPSLVGVAERPPVLYREFQCGAVVLNGDKQPHTVFLEPGLARLTGTQAPRWQFFVDDASTSFAPLTGNWTIANFDNGYDGVNAPSQEQVRPSNGYYHHWATGAHQAAGGSSASFNLNVPEAGTYNVSMWWPAAVPARAGWSQAMTITISPSGTQVVVNLTSDGGDMFYPIASVALEPSSTLTVACPAGGGDCIADAVLVESAARWNDGSAATSVTLQPMDAIVLAKQAGCATM